MTTKNKAMNNFIRSKAGRVIAQQPQPTQPPAIAQANAGNNTGDSLPAAPLDMNAFIRDKANHVRYIPTIKGKI